MFLSSMFLVLLGCSDDADSTGPTSSGSGAGGGGTGGAGGEGGGGPATVTFTTFVGAEQSDLLFVAAQDGDGAWQPLTGMDGVYSFAATDRFGIAYVCEEPTSIPSAVTAVWIVHATTADFTSLVRVCMGPPPSNTTAVTGTVTGLNVGSSDSAILSMGPYGSAAAVTSAFQMDVPQGTWDLTAIRNVGGIGGVTDRIIVRRDVVVGATPVVENFDFQNDGTAMLLRDMTITNAGASDTVVMNSFLRPRQGGGLFLSAPNPSIAVVPSSELSGDDTHFINCFVSNPMTGGGRSAETQLKEPPVSGVEFTLLDALTASVSVASTDPLQFRATFGAVTTALGYRLRIGQNSTARRLFVDVTAGWLGSGAELEYTTPDLTMLAGWDSSWELALGEVTDWFAGAHDSTGALDFDDDATPGPDPAKEGVITRGSLQGGQVTP